MPVSYHEPYHEYQRWVKRRQPKTMWDIGMGYGNIGYMAKIIVPGLELNGVEGFIPYLANSLSHASEFKRIIVADVKDLIGKLWEVDMVTAFDVIEHLEEEDGIRVIEYLKSIANMGLLVALPIVDYPQGAVNNNDLEIHRTQWTVEKMEKIGGKTRFAGKVCGLFEFNK